MKRLGSQLALAAGIALTVLAARGDDLMGASSWPTEEFHFTRMYYNDFGYGWRGRSYRTDFPEAEEHFTLGVARLTRVDIGKRARMLEVTDDAIFDYPWLYAVEVGRWQLDDNEAARLREYLLRGGFLMTDDFHGTQQWAVFVESMQRVFPDRPIVEIPDDDEVKHVLYDLEEHIQIPGIYPWMGGVTYEQDGVTPHWRGIYDDLGRLMVAINFNMDLGDAWEHANDPRYPEPMTGLATRYAVNYVIYAMTH
jgi:hypothetical protein